MPENATDGLPMRQRYRTMDLLLATNELQASVQRLVEPVMSYINNTYLEIPSLYAQLWVEMDSCRGSAASAPSSRPPMNISAYDAKQSLDTFIDSLRFGSAGAPIASLRAIASRAWTVDDIDEVKFITRKLTRYGDDIERLINAEHVKEIIAACPACGKSWVERRDGGGATVWSRALQASAEFGCTCQACETHWAPSQLMELATDANLPATEGVKR